MSSSINWNRAFVVGCLVVVGLLALFSRVHLLDIPLERDEGDYAYHAALLLDGTSLGDEVVLKRYPLIYFTYALWIGLLGATATAVHLGLLIFHAGTAYVLYRFVSDAYRRNTGLLATGFFLVMMLSPSLHGLSANREHFVIAMAWLGVWGLWRSRSQPQVWGLLLAGLAMGCSFLYKPSGAFLTLAGGLWLVGDTWIRDKNILAVLKRGLLYSIGFFVPFLLVVLLYKSLGAFDAFWFKTVTLNQAYTDQLGLSARWQNFTTNFGRLAAQHWLLLAGAALGIVRLVLTWRQSQSVLLLLLTGASLYTIIPGGFFRPHYFIHIAPVVAVLAILGLEWGLQFIRQSTTQQWTGALLVIVMVGEPLVKQVDYWAAPDGHTASRMVYGANPFPEAEVLGRFIDQSFPPDARMVVMGSEPELYFHANRKGINSQLYMYDLTNASAYASALQDTFQADVEKTLPACLVMVNVSVSWLVEKDTDREIFDWLNSFIPVHYRPILVADILPNGTQYITGEAAVGYQPRSSASITVYRKMAR